jgi:hypothetical protein
VLVLHEKYQHNRLQEHLLWDFFHPMDGFVKPRLLEAEILLHTCLASTEKSVSKIKGRPEVCKEKETRKCQNTGIF